MFLKPSINAKTIFKKIRLINNSKKLTTKAKKIKDNVNNLI